MVILSLHVNSFTGDTMADKPFTLIIYTSMSGHTEALARALADGARQSRNTSADLKRARDVTPEDIDKASALAFGSPTYFSYMSGELKMFFDEFLIRKDKFKGKPAIAFATGDGGQLKCIQSIEDIMEYFEVDMVHRSDIISAGLAIQGVPDENALKTARNVGTKLAEAGKCLVCREATEKEGVTIGDQKPSMH